MAVQRVVGDLVDETQLYTLVQERLTIDDLHRPNIVGVARAEARDLLLTRARRRVPSVGVERAVRRLVDQPDCRACAHQGNRARGRGNLGRDNVDTRQSPLFFPY